LDAGILTERHAGRTRLITANLDSPLVAPIRDILTVVMGPATLLTAELSKIAGIERAFIYGSFAARMLGNDGPAPHDVDVMIIGAPDVAAVYDACSRVESAV